MNSNPEMAKRRLDDASHLKDRTRRAAWLMLILGAAIAVVLAVALLDYGWLLPRPARWVAFGLLAALLAAGAFRLSRLLRRPATLKEVALDVEARDPSLGCTISTAAEYLSGERKIEHEYEPGLVAALETQAGALLAPVKLPYARRVWLPAALCVGAVVVLAGFLVSASGAWTALRRTTVPWSSAAYTKIEVQPGHTEVPIGGRLSVKGLFQGREPRNPQLQWREDGATAWQAASLTLDTNRTATHEWPEVRRSLTYRVTGGDAASAEYRVDAYVPAEVKELQIRLDYPAYTRLSSTTQAVADVVALRGTAATFTLIPNTRLAQARLVCDKVASVDLQPGPGESWTGTLPVTKDTAYTIELRDTKNRLGLIVRTNSVRALPDEPPQVEIVEPAKDLRSEATNTVAVKITATDDYGVGEIRLVYHRLGGPEKSLVAKLASPAGKAVTNIIDLPLEPLKLQPYEVVAYHAEARDNNTLDGPGVGKSPVYFIEITDEKSADGKPPKKPMPGAKVNLLVIQKQIISDTRGLAKDAAPEKFGDLAAREKDATDFAQMYRDSMAQGGAPEAAMTLMDDAMKALNGANVALQSRNRASAIPPEEQALASLYQVLKLMPELQNLPVQPPKPSEARTNAPPSQMVQVVLEAIKQKKGVPDAQEIEEMLESAEAMANAQASINHMMRPSANNAAAGSGNQTGRQAEGGQDEDTPQTDRGESKQGQGQNAQAQNGQGQQGKAQQGQGQQGEGKEGQQGKDGQGQQGQGQQGQGKEGQGQQGKDGQGQGQQGQGQQGQGQQGQNGQGQQGKDGQGQGQQGQGQQGQQGQGQQGQGQQGQGKEGQGQGKDGQGKGGKGGQGKGGEPGQNAPPDLAQAQQKQEALSKEAQALTEKLQRLADKDERVGHNVAQTMKNAAKNMKGAAQGIQVGDRVGASQLGTQASRELNTAAAMLHQILEAERQLGDVSHEDYPAEYEVAIRDYLKRLSYQE